MMKKMKKYENNMVDEIQPTINLLRIQMYNLNVQQKATVSS